MHVAILLYDGFDELDAIAPFEVFANAADAGADCTVSLRTLDDDLQVTASHGLRVEADGTLDALDTNPDLLVVPGGGWNDRSSAGAWTEAERGTIPDRVASLHADGVAVAAVCTGGMLLAHAGVLDGRPATTPPSARDDLRATDAAVVDARVVDDGDVVTAGGVTAGIDLALWLLEREFGAEVADGVARTLEHDRSEDVHRA
jgi:transcriptional regulator GlxA family with amidase domain